MTGGTPSLGHAGRVVRVERGSAEVRLADRVVAVPVADRALLVGDRVDVCVGPGPATVLAVRPRTTVVARAATDRTSGEQALAVNVDVVVVVEPMDPTPSLGRIERLLVLAWSSGARPLVVLTKADLASGGHDLHASVQAAAPGVDVLAVSAPTGAGLDGLRERLGPGRTFVLLGPSGAGKSTLVNALAGTDLLAVGDVRGDGRGRHTTTHRELVELPDGSSLIDTPGLRAVGLLGDAAAVDDVFAEIAGLARDCRFRDCAHDTEPGCAVQAAVAEGGLPERRLASWRRLQREIAYQNRRGDARLQAEERAKWKAIVRRQRAHAAGHPSR
jgi:ribosome biogenesis GTPase